MALYTLFFNDEFIRQEPDLKIIFDTMDKIIDRNDMFPEDTFQIKWERNKNGKIETVLTSKYDYKGKQILCMK